MKKTRISGSNVEMYGLRVATTSAKKFAFSNFKTKSFRWNSLRRFGTGQNTSHQRRELSSLMRNWIQNNHVFRTTLMRVNSVWRLANEWWQASKFCANLETLVKLQIQTQSDLRHFSHIEWPQSKFPDFSFTCADYDVIGWDNNWLMIKKTM